MKQNTACQQKKTPPMLFVLGPTASGKTALGVTLARRFSGEVISADAMQIYKGFPIATAQPTPEETQGVPHHMLALSPPTEKWSVARYAAVARQCAEEIYARGKIPIVAGGTGQYAQALFFGLEFPEEGDGTALRRELESEYDLRGGAVFLEEIRETDPATAARLHPNDKKRVIRAVELHRGSGETITLRNEKSRAAGVSYDGKCIFLFPQSRAWLYARIEKRADEMMVRGLVREARMFFDGAYAETAAQAIGCKEMKPYLDGECGLEDALEQIKIATRHYAKRQLTWLRRMEREVTRHSPDAAYIASCDEDGYVAQVIERTERWFGKNS